MSGLHAYRRERVAYDADEHAHNLSRWEQSYNQFSAGRFEGRITELWLPKLQIFLESANQALHQSCAAWPDALWFGLPVPNNRMSRIDARPVPNDAILCRRGGSQFELYTPERYAIFGLVVDQRLLNDYLIDVEGIDPEFVSGGSVLNLVPEIYRQLIAAVGQALESPPDVAATAGGAQDLQERILAPLGAALSSSPKSFAHRQHTRIRHSRKIVESARDWVLSRPDQRLSIAELCRELHVSRRSLQYCFQDVVGLSPLAYLRTLKLNQVRRGLYTASDPSSRVTQIATAWGFEHLGQFSRDYHNLFGESPSVTLRVHR